MTLEIVPGFKLFASILKKERYGYYEAVAPGYAKSCGWWLGWVHVGYWVRREERE